MRIVMKKRMGIGLLTFLFFLTGCNQNRLVCTASDDTNGIDTDVKYTFIFEKDSASKATMKATSSLSGENFSEELISALEASALNAAEDYNQVDGIEAKVSSNKDKVTLDVEILAAGLSEENKKLYGMDLDKETLKKQLEESGYTCK